MRFRALVYLAVLISLGFLTACSTKNSSNTGGTGALFVTTQGDSLITPYTIDLSTGKFTANGKAVATDRMPSAVVLSSKGDALFVANSASNSITAYAVNSDGTLTAAGSTQTQGIDPVSMAMDSAGHLFIVNEGSATISIFTVSGTDFMGPALFSTVTATTGTDPSAVAITSNGKFLYITDKVGGTVTEYNVDASGNLSQPVSYFVGTTPAALIITDLKNGSADTSNFLYVGNSGSNNVSAFSICDNPSTTCVTQPDGALTPAFRQQHLRRAGLVDHVDRLVGQLGRPSGASHDLVFYTERGQHGCGTRLCQPIEASRHGSGRAGINEISRRSVGGDPRMGCRTLERPVRHVG